MAAAMPAAPEPTTTTSYVWSHVSFIAFSLVVVATNPKLADAIADKLAARLTD
ncbi:hypothetical protein ACWD5B_38405 [Streptomyces tanashiensis]